MNNTDAFNKLRSLLENKTIAKIEPPGADEAICKFVLLDGSAFRLHATDLGFWIEETADGNGYYDTLNALMVDYYHHLYSGNCLSNFNEHEAKISYHDNTLWFEASDGKNFKIEMKNLSDQEIQIVDHPLGLSLLKEASVFGDMWQIIFCASNENCPPVLYLIRKT